MAYQDAVCYFYSGTGNSYRVAAWMAEDADRLGTPARVLPIHGADPRAEIGDGAGHLVGLAFPTHGFTTPWQVLRFIGRLPRRHGTHALVLVSRAGTKFGRVFFPGLEGTAGYLAALLLRLRGYHVRAVRGIDMPSNWIALHPGYGQASAEAIVARARPRVDGIMTDVLGGRRHFGGWIELLLGLLLLPVSAGFMVMGRFYLAKLFFATQRCTGCGICAQNCPNQGVIMRGRPPRPYWTLSCESCMRCMNFCPLNAVEASQPLAVLLYFVTALPGTLLVFNWLGSRLPGLAGVAGNPWGRRLIQYPYTLFAIWLTYLAFDRLLRVPALNRLFTLTTPTHYYQRYHEPGASLNRLNPRPRNIKSPRQDISRQ